MRGGGGQCLWTEGRLEQPGPGKRGRRKGGEDAESGFSKQSNQSEAIAPPEDGGGRKLRN